MTQFTKQELLGKPVVELRRLARNQVRQGRLVLADNLADTNETIAHWIVCANQHLLVNAILTETASNSLLSSSSHDSPHSDDGNLTATDVEHDEAGSQVADETEAGAGEPVDYQAIDDAETAEASAASTVDGDGDVSTPPPPPTTPPGLEGLIRIIANDEAGKLYDKRSGDSKEKIQALAELIKAELANGNGHAPVIAEPQTLTIHAPAAAPITIDNAHKQLAPTVLALSINKYVFLWGASGSGKSTIAKHAAEALGIEFHPFSCSKDMQSYTLFGYQTADGTYIPGAFRKAYEHGGLFLMDEIDTASDNITNPLNSALANGFCRFPDRVVERHIDFRLVGTGNTPMTGADNLYTGRKQQDAAFADRFDLFLEVNYDSAIETLMANGNVVWRDFVWLVRAAVKECGIQTIITPRAVKRGADLLAAGMSRKVVEQGALYRGLAYDDIKMIRKYVKDHRPGAIATATATATTTTTTTDSGVNQ